MTRMFAGTNATLALVVAGLLSIASTDRPAPSGTGADAQPIIDVHKHASWPGADDAAARNALLAEMDAEGIVLSLLSLNEPGDVAGWLQAAPGRFIGGPAMPCPVTPQAPFFRCFAETKGWPDLTWLEREMAAGKIGVLGEMLFVYTGVHPDDKRMAPYWALAAKYDVPVAVHINRGPPPGVGPRSDPRCCPAPADVHQAELRRLIDAGFGGRIMFGSDTRPAGPILRRLQNIDWLSTSQRRAILYDNAARFLRLDAPTIARHHGR